MMLFLNSVSVNGTGVLTAYIFPSTSPSIRLRRQESLNWTTRWSPRANCSGAVSVLAERLEAMRIGGLLASAELIVTKGGNSSYSAM